MAGSALLAFGWFAAAHWAVLAANPAAVSQADEFGGSATSALPGLVSFSGSRSFRASAGESPPSSAARSTIDRPVFTDAFTISAARAYPSRGASAVARLTVRSA